MGRVQFRTGLLLAGLLGFALRAVFALSNDKRPGTHGDDDWYHAMANQLADGHGYVNPFRVVDFQLVSTGGHGAPTAFHPPLFPWLLTVFSELGLRSYTAHELAGCLMGAGTVVVVGLLTRELAGESAGLLAALVAAVSLPLIGDDAVLMSESLYGLTVACALYAAVRLLRAPGSRLWAVLLGVAVAAAALTRGEGIFLLLVLALPVAVVAQRAGWLRRLGLIVLACAVVIAPWSARNTHVFGQPVFVTTTDGATLLSANAPTTYHGRLLGYFDYRALLAAGRLPTNEAKAAAIMRRKAIDFAGDHTGRLPVVAAARVARTWGVWPPSQQADIALGVHNQPRVYALLALAFYALTLGLSAWAVWRFRRQIPEMWVLITPAALVTLTSLVAYGDVRFRIGLDIALAALSGIALAALLGRELPWAQREALPRHDLRLPDERARLGAHEGHARVARLQRGA